MFTTMINLIFYFSISIMTIFSAEENISTLGWQIVDDVVMGGRSNGNFEIDENGYGVFSGYVSLENNGGFSSLRGRTETVAMSEFDFVSLRIKGDGKSYQFRIKSSTYDRHSYIAHFQTDGSWQTINIALSDMYPAFRGRKLSMPNYPSESMAEIAFLIGNKKPESFQLIIDEIVFGQQKLSSSTQKR